MKAAPTVWWLTVFCFASITLMSGASPLIAESVFRFGGGLFQPTGDLALEQSSSFAAGPDQRFFLTDRLAATPGDAGP